MVRVLAAVAVAGLVLGGGIAGGKPTAVQKCRYYIVYENSIYDHVSRDDVTRGDRVGRAVRPGCNDTGGPKPPDKPVQVFRFGTASPRVALTVQERGQADSLVAIPARCFGFGYGPGYRNCLQTEVRFRGRGYAAVRGRKLSRTHALGAGSLRGRPIRLDALEGIDPRIALARSDKPLQILVAHRRCEFGAIGPLFLRCLRAPLWLEINHTGAIRTVAVARPGSLVSNVQLPLYLAPEPVADEIVAPDDERLTTAGYLNVDSTGQGAAKIAVVATLESGTYSVVADCRACTRLPAGRRMVVIGTLFV